MALLTSFKIVRLFKPKLLLVSRVAQYGNKFVGALSKPISLNNNNWRDKKSVEEIKLNEQNSVVIDEVKGAEETGEIEETESVPPIRRRFAKSGAQIALAMPLKPSRLASPFPEPVKAMPSDTVSDEEKSRLMHEEAKMEARYRLQQQQEKLHEKKLHAKEQKQTQSSKQKKSENKKSTAAAASSSSPSSSSNKKCNAVNFRHQQTKSYGTIATEYQMKASQRMEVVTDKTRAKGRRVKVHRNRSAKYLKYSRNPTRQYRRTYMKSSFPLADASSESEMQHCDIILERLKALDPKYCDIKKPIFLPGSDEEKKFVKYVLKLIGEYKQDSRKQGAPYPSYSEVKTCMRSVRTLDQDSAAAAATASYDNKKEIHINETSQKKQQQQQLDRSVAPYPSFSEMVNESAATDPNSTHNNNNNNNNNVITTGSGRNAFSTVNGLTMPKQSGVCVKVGAKKFSTISSHIKMNLTLTYSNLNLYNRQQQRMAFCTEKFESNQTCNKNKNKPPSCPNPYPNLPICDYEGANEKERREKKKKQDSIDKCNKKKCDSSNITYTNVDVEENEVVINKIRDWLSTWQKKSDNIKITKCKTMNDIEDRETYVIEITETENLPIKHEQIKSELVKMDQLSSKIKSATDSKELLPTAFSDNDKVIINNIPDYMSIDHLARKKEIDVVRLSQQTNKEGGACPPEQSIPPCDPCRDKYGEKIEKCRKVRKTPLPECCPEKKKKKKTKYSNVQETITLSQAWYGDRNDILNTNEQVFKTDDPKTATGCALAAIGKKQFFSEPSVAPATSDTQIMKLKSLTLKDNKFVPKVEKDEQVFKLKPQFWRK